MFKDSLFKKIEEKTNVNKETIISLANKLQNSNMKDEKVLNELIDDLSTIAGKKISDEKRKQLLDTIVNDKIPKNIDKMI